MNIFLSLGAIFSATYPCLRRGFILYNSIFWNHLSLMSKRKKIYEGKAKILYEGPEAGTLIQYFKDDATAFNAEKHATIKGKGALNCSFCEFFMNGLTMINVPNHFIRRLNMREHLVRQVEIIPLEIIMRNFASGSLVKRLGITEGQQLSQPILEFCYKDDALGDPFVSEDHITAFGWASPQELEDIATLASRVNDFLAGILFGVGIKLIDFKIEIGRVWHGDYTGLIIADEISPDSCRFWDIASGEKFDKDVFRHDLGDLSQAYSTLARRLGLLHINLPTGKPTLVDKI